MKRKVITLLLSLIMLIGLLPASAFAADGDPLLDPGVSIRINRDLQQPIDANGEPVYPIIYDGTTYVAVRGISYLFGKGVDWEAATRTVLLTDSSVPVPLLKSTPKPTATYLPGIRPDQGIKIKYNGIVKQLTNANGMPVYPISYNGTTYIPVRGVATLFGKTVGWDISTRTVLITDTIGVMRDITATELVADMKIGTNHYRAFGSGGIKFQDNIGYKSDPDPNNSYSKVTELTLWGEGLTATVPADFAGAHREDGGTGTAEFYTLEKFEKVIQAFSDAGYNAVRLPVSWTPYTDDKTYVIDKEWLDLVEAAVRIILDKGMYCIIDVHEDYLDWSWVGDHWTRDWIMAQYKTYVDSRYTAIWKQIAERFKNYSDYLLFESFNEPLSGDNDVQYSAERINELQALFVKTVRDTGGNNTRRFLSLTHYNPVCPENLQYLKLPDDDKLIVQVHFYPRGDSQDPTYITSWDRNKVSYTASINKFFTTVKQFMDRTGVPVIVGEFANTESMPLADRADQAAYVVEKAADIGVPVFWWECTLNTTKDREIGQSFSLYNRDKMAWYYPEIIEVIMKVVYGMKSSN